MTCIVPLTLSDVQVDYFLNGIKTQFNFSNICHQQIQGTVMLFFLVLDYKGAMYLLCMCFKCNPLKVKPSSGDIEVLPRYRPFNIMAGQPTPP